MKFRKEVAKEIAERLTEFLINHMKSRDTVNGYPVDKEGEG